MNLILAIRDTEPVFKDITTGEVTHTTILDTAGVADYRSVIDYFAKVLMKDLRVDIVTTIMIKSSYNL